MQKIFLKEYSHKAELLADNRVVETYNIYDTERELVRAIDNTHNLLISVNHIIVGWDKAPLKNFHLACVEAINTRKVNIKRIFILNDDVVKDRIKLGKAMALMDRQKRDGVRVFVALESDLQKESNYKEFALVDSRFFDTNLLVFNSAQNKGTTMAKFTWDLNEIEEKTPFSFFEKSKKIGEYD